MYKIPKQNQKVKKKNSVSQIFWGRIQVENAAALYQFHKEGSIEKLISQLKYEDGKSTGIFLGEQIGYAIKEIPFFCNLDYIIPVPLPQKKEKLRGYNQSKYIVKGIQEIINIEVNTELLIRKENTDYQTRRKRFSRW